MTILKIKFNDDVRRITLENAPTFVELQGILRDLFRQLPESFVVKYTDEEEDLVSMCSDMELKEAFEIANQSPTKILRMNITADNSTAPFVVSQKDVTQLSAASLQQLINSQGFQQLITSPGFQQLLPAIINSEAFKQKLVPQVINSESIQQVLPAMTNISPGVTTLFEAMIPMLLASTHQSGVHRPAPPPPTEAPATPPIPAASTSTPAAPSSQQTTPSASPTTTPATPAAATSHTLKKDVVLDSKSFDCDSFEVVEISETTSSTSSAISTSITSLSNSGNASTNLTPTPSQQENATTSSSSPAVEKKEGAAPTIPQDLAEFVQTLVNMGFTDIARNVQLLTEHNGNLFRDRKSVV